MFLFVCLSARLGGSIRYLHEDMDIRSFFGASTSSVASSITHTEKMSNCSDSDSNIAEPPSKKARRELNLPSTTKTKILKELGKRVQLARV